LEAHFEKLVHLIELKRFRGAPKGSPFSPLVMSFDMWFHCYDHGKLFSVL
jgi:hypothetical protein